MTSLAAHRPDNAPREAARPASRAEKAFERARRHSGRVRVLKLLLPAAAILMTAVFVGKSWLASPIAGVSVNFGGTIIEDGRLVMAEPRLDGFTGDDRPYSMSAARAIQDIGASGRIDLEEIDARLPFEADKWMTVAARSGTYDRDANTLDIDSEIRVVTDTGITALLKSATVDMGRGSLATDDPVDITLDGARIEAESMRVSEGGAVMVFENRVRMQMDPARMQTAGTAADGGSDGN